MQLQNVFFVDLKTIDESNVVKYKFIYLGSKEIAHHDLQNKKYNRILVYIDESSFVK